MGLNLHYERYGRGAPIVILHGLFGSRRNWHTIATQLADRYCIYTIDARNHGESPHASTMSYRNMTGDLTGFIDALGTGPVTVLGHSMGGKTAMLAAVTRPELIARLIIVDIAPVSSVERFGDLIDVLLALPLDSMIRRSDADRWLRRAIPDRSLRLFLLQNLVAKDGRFCWRLNLPALKTSLPAITAAPGIKAGTSYSGPTQFILGGLSGAVLAQHYGVIKQHFPAAQIDTIAEAGHWPHADKPDAFLKTLQDFLDGTADS